MSLIEEDNKTIKISFVAGLFFVDGGSRRPSLANLSCSDGKGKKYKVPVIFKCKDVRINLNLRWHIKLTVLSMPL